MEEKLGVPVKLMDDVVGEEVEKACADPEAWLGMRWRGSWRGWGLEWLKPNSVGVACFDCPAALRLCQAPHPLRSPVL